MNLLSSLGVLDLVGTVTTILLIYVAHFYYKYFTRVNPLPGAIPLPLVGDLFGIIYYANGDLAFWHKILRERYGDVFETHIGNTRKIVFVRADHVEKMMAPSTKSIYMTRTVLSPAVNEFGMGARGLVMNCNVPSWRFNRKIFSQAILTPSFSREVLYWTPILFDELNGYWKEIGENNSIDFAIWIHKFTTEIIFQMTIGMKVNSMTTYFNQVIPSKKKYIKPNPVIEDVENYIELLLNGFDDFIFALTFSPFVRFNFMKKRNQIMINNLKMAETFTENIINHRRKQIEETPIEEELRNDLLTSLIITNTERDNNKSKNTADEEYSKPITNDQIGQTLREAIVGGVDTTANVLCYVIYYMAHYPDVLTRLRKEIDSIFGSNSNHQITFEDIQKLTYTEAIIKECSRLINAVKLIDRVSSAPDVVAGYEWPAETTFTCYVEGLHYNSNYWKDPHKFDPDRFMGTEPQKNSFLMFGGGVRICPGRRLANVEMKCLIALIYRNLDISLVDMDAPLNLRHNVVNTCLKLEIKVKERKI